MIRRILTPLFVVGFFCIGHSQQTDSLESIYKKQAIWLHMPYYFKGGERMHYKGLKNEFGFSPNGLIEYEVGIKKYRTGRIFAFTALASTIGALFTINSNQDLSIGLFAGSVIINAVGIKFSLDGRKRIQKAVFIRNQDLLFPPAIR